MRRKSYMLEISQSSPEFRNWGSNTGQNLASSGSPVLLRRSPWPGWLFRETARRVTTTDDRRAPTPSPGCGRMATVELTVPAGVAAGDPLEFEHDGTLYNAVVPEGLGEGDVFQIEVSAAHPAGSFTDYLESRASSGDLMDRFVAWFESHGIEEQFETFLAEHAHLVKGAADGSEQSHEWWPVYQTYQAKFDALLQEFLTEAGVSAEEFLTAAKSASGMNDIILKIFLRASNGQRALLMAVPEVGSRASSGRARQL
eukprot:scaffold73987_cov70-Phaeocystis_antarctica.AAC.4